MDLQQTTQQTAETPRKICEYRMKAPTAYLIMCKRPNIQEHLDPTHRFIAYHASTPLYHLSAA